MTAMCGASEVAGTRQAGATSAGMPYTAYASAHTAAASAICLGVVARLMCTSAGGSAGESGSVSTIKGAGSPNMTIPASSATSMRSSSRPTSA